MHTTSRLTDFFRSTKLGTMSSIAQAFKNLALSAEDASDHDSIYEVSYEYLSKVKNFNDVKSFHNCMVSLINMDKYQQAFKLVQKVPEDIHSQFPIEKAYVYYKLGRSDLLNDVYEQRDKSDLLADRALKHVFAQDCYRKGDSANALHLIHELITSNTEFDSNSDLGCNERAVLSQMRFMDKRQQSVPVSIESDNLNYDCLFNDALVKIAFNQLHDALQLLEKAQSICTIQNQDLEAADLLLELAPIKLTIAYAYQLQGRKDEAKALLDEFNGNETVDLMTKLITLNNYYSLETISEPNLSIALRDLDYQARTSKLQLKLTKPQLKILLKNKLLLQLHGNTISKTSKYLSNSFISEYQKLYPGDYTFYVYKVLNLLDISVTDINEGNAEQFARKLYQHSKNDLSEHEKLATILLLVTVNNILERYNQSIAVLEDHIGTKSQALVPAFAGILLGLFEETSNNRSVSEEAGTKIKSKQDGFIDTLVSHFKEHGVSKIYNFAREVAFKLYQRNDVRAEEVFSLLRQQDPEDKLVGAVLDRSNAQLDSIDSLKSVISVDELLATPISSMIPAPTVRKSRGTAAIASLKVHKKSRKPRFGAKKEYVNDDKFNAAGLDEERWLPMRLRSYYKPTKKDRKKGGQQGAIEQPKDKKKKKSKK